MDGINNIGTCNLTIPLGDNVIVMGGFYTQGNRRNHFLTKYDMNEREI
jgi:hypothetical protein